MHWWWIYFKTWGSSHHVQRLVALIVFVEGKWRAVGLIYIQFLWSLIFQFIQIVLLGAAEMSKLLIKLLIKISRSKGIHRYLVKIQCFLWLIVPRLWFCVYVTQVSLGLLMHDELFEVSDAVHHLIVWNLIRLLVQFRFRLVILLRH